MLLTYAERQTHWEWCRSYIDHQVIYRADETHPPIPSRARGGTYTWQFYLRRATFHPEFAHRLGLLFWDHFLPKYEQQPFQVCACDPSGPPIGMTISATARRIGLPMNVFIVRREPKGFGLDNWFDGRILSLPVLMVDDVAASAPFIRAGSARVQSKLGLPLHYNYFTICNKVGRGFDKRSQHTESYLDNELVSLFTMNNFAKTVVEYRERYGASPAWEGLVK